MSATECLRQLLDERGVKYETYIELQTGFEHVKWNFNKHGSADFNLEFGEPWLTMYGVVSGPEQAVEATLGRGTCRKVRAWEDDPRGGGGWVLVCSECDELLANDGEDGEFDGPNYCPNCGRRVEKWRKESSA